MAAAAARRSSDHTVPGHPPRQTARRPFLRRTFLGDHRSRRARSPRSRTSPSQAHSCPRGKQCAKSESVDSAGTHHPPTCRGGTPRPEARRCRAGRSRHGPAGTQPARHRGNPRRRRERAVVHAGGPAGGVTGEQPPRNGPGQTGPVPPVPDLTAGPCWARPAHERWKEVFLPSDESALRLPAPLTLQVSGRAGYCVRTQLGNPSRVIGGCEPACWPQRLTLTSSRHSTRRLRFRPPTT
ncbi:hypothetical protein SAMN04488074_12831 [Lentzea albidocapillata subsp. violacea]|uniref:Uncharacterized protein n=1 Tax=Lentzea albidocapillata subsp. violacea TaxID=128104 RepID=A0A1G9WPA2_9PSEU|nr:hypothetical protein SAMN04488074_12831 [Lentzea albidocapillata subsp. violacea]